MESQGIHRLVAGDNAVHDLHNTTAADFAAKHKGKPHDVFFTKDGRAVVTKRHENLSHHGKDSGKEIKLDDVKYVYCAPEDQFHTVRNYKKLLKAAHDGKPKKIKPMDINEELGELDPDGEDFFRNDYHDIEDDHGDMDDGMDYYVLSDGRFLFFGEEPFGDMGGETNHYVKYWVTNHPGRIGIRKFSEDTTEVPGKDVNKYLDMMDPVDREEHEKYLNSLHADNHARSVHYHEGKRTKRFWTFINENSEEPVFDKVDGTPDGYTLEYKIHPDERNAITTSLETPYGRFSYTWGQMPTGEKEWRVMSAQTTGRLDDKKDNKKIWKTLLNFMEDGIKSGKKQVDVAMDLANRFMEIVPEVKN